MELRNAIRDSYLAQGLTEAQLELIYPLGTVRSFEDGEFLVRQDDDVHDLFLVVGGRALIIGVTGEPIGYVKPGMPVGEISFLDGKPRSVSVVSDGGCDAIVLGYEPLWKLLRENQDIALRALLNISRVLCTRLRYANRNLAALMVLDELDGSLGSR